MRTNIIDVPENLNSEIELCGWIDVRRDHGKLIFFDMRDRSGKVQLVVPPSDKVVHEIASILRPEWVVKIKGTVNPRPEAMKNPKEGPAGGIEVKVSSIEIISEAKTPPFEVGTDGYEVGEDVRMKYRYVDIRRARMMNNLAKRSQVTKFIRDFLIEKSFIEVETPSLSKSTPEGARDYLVPSRVEPGKFYALPQSPQQYKQLLMVGGIERYFQIARCFRDEDTRGDRQPEFTQLDMEMSFVEQEDVMALNEEILTALVETLFPEKTIQEKPFPRLNYADVMKEYGNDRPDLRRDKNDPNLLAFAWVVNFPFFEKTPEGGWTFTHNPFSSPKPEHMDDLLAKKNIEGIIATQYDVVLNGFEIAGGSIRNHKPEALRAVFSIMGFSDEQIEENFGHMFKAFSSGTPPHGGIAWGFDRIMMLLLNQPNIREVIVFPKTSDGKDLMMDAPSAVAAKQLREVGISLRSNEKNNE